MKIEEFIKSQIASVDELRALLLFRASPQTSRDADGTAVKLYIPPSVAANVLARLAAKGFLVADGERPNYYRFQPQTPELAGLIGELAELDRQRPVTLIKMIYDRPKQVQAFADAFKLKKES